MSIDPITLDPSETHTRYVALFEAHFADIWKFARRRCGSGHDADDVTAETFAVAWRRRDELPGEDTRLWLFGVARRVLANQQRSAQRQERVRLRLAETTTEGAVRRRNAGVHGGHAAGPRCVVGGRARPNHHAGVGRTVHRGDGDILGCSCNAVSLRLHKARRRLARELRGKRTWGPDMYRANPCHRKEEGYDRQRHELAQALSGIDPAITDPPPVKGSIRYSSILEAAMNNEPTRDDRPTARAPRSRLRWTRRRLAMASAAVGVVAVALVIGMTVLPGLPGSGTAQAAVKVQTVDGRYVIWFTKMAEDTKVVEDELASLGLDVKIDFVSASPSMVGTLVASDGGDGTEEFLPCVGSGRSDPRRLGSARLPQQSDALGRPSGGAWRIIFDLARAWSRGTWRGSLWEPHIRHEGEGRRGGSEGAGSRG